MQYNYLKAKMMEHSDTQRDLAVAIGVSLSRFNAKINRVRGADFTLRELREIKRRYDLTAAEIDTIFL